MNKSGEFYPSHFGGIPVANNTRPSRLTPLTTTLTARTVQRNLSAKREAAAQPAKKAANRYAKVREKAYRDAMVDMIFADTVLSAEQSFGEETPIEPPVLGGMGLV